MPDTLTLEQGLALLLEQSSGTGGSANSQRHTEAEVADRVNFQIHPAGADQAAELDRDEPCRLHSH